MTVPQQCSHSTSQPCRINLCGMTESLREEQFDSGQTGPPDCSGSCPKWSAPERNAWEQTHTSSPEQSKPNSSCPDADCHFSRGSTPGLIGPAAHMSRAVSLDCFRGKIGQVSIIFLVCSFPLLERA